MSLLPVDEALARILKSAEPHGTEQVALSDAGGRVVATSVLAHFLQPPFDGSAMDGYALIAPNDISYPVKFDIIGESAAGNRFEGELGVGQAVRIFTGAPLPTGTDTIVIQEHTERFGNRLTVHEGIEPGRHIRRAGLDFRPAVSSFRAGVSWTPLHCRWQRPAVMRRSAYSKSQKWQLLRLVMSLFLPVKYPEKTRLLHRTVWELPRS